MGYKHVIWDWNGTLLDDVDLAVYVMQKMLKERDMPVIDVAKYKEILTFPIKKYYEAVGFDFLQYSFEDLSNDFVAGYAKHFDRCTLHKGAKETLQKVREAGMSQSILTAGPQKGVDMQVRFFGIRDYFEVLTGDSDHHASGKIKLVKRHMEAIALSGGDVVFIGDTDHDVEVAGAIGCDCMLVSFGHQSCEILRATGYPVADSYQEVLDYIFAK